MTTRTYSVPAISCDHCRRAIEGQVNKLAGADLVQVDVQRKEVRVEGDVADEAVRGAIDEAGYEVEAVV